MNCIFLLLAPALIVAQISLRAQESTPAPAPGTPPPAVLTPPPDATPQTNSTVNSTAPAVAPTPAANISAPAAGSNPAGMSREDIARVQQQEIIRRQELVFRANQALVAAQKAELGTSYSDARQNYLFAAEAFGSISRSTASYAKAAEGLTRIDFHLYDDALKAGDMPRAKLLIDEVIKYNPNNKPANEKLATINRALANPNDTTLLGNVAVTPGLVKKVNEIQDLFAEAEQFKRTGQWDQAEDRLKHILSIDIYNIAATKQLELIESEKNTYADKARLEMRDERLRQVEEKWYEPLNNRDVATHAQEDQPAITQASNFGIEQELKGIILPSLDFTTVSIEEATSFLTSKSKELDPDHKGVNFIIQPLASTTAKPISLTLNAVPLGEALRYVCQLAGVKYKVQDYAISIVPFNQNTDDLISRTFNVEPNFVVPPNTTTITSVTSAFGNRPVGNAATDTTAQTTTVDPVRQALEAKGVKFPEGASAVYTPATGQLTVVNTADQMELIEELVNAGQAPTLMVRVATKFVEINQSDLNDLTINSAFNFLNPVLLGKSNVAPSFATSLPGSQAFAPNSIDQLLTPETFNFNSIYVKSFLSGGQFNAVLYALSQKKSFDLLTEPFTMVKSGEQGVIEAVRVFPYPIAFDPPQTQTTTQNQGAAGNTTGLLLVAEPPPAILPSTPTDFKRRNVGVRLVIKPQITSDNKTIDLSLFPEVTDFQGFINYGSPIFVGNPDGTSTLLSPNTINQPVFNTRRINTKVLVKDGSTVVMGGLIRDDQQSVNDKVPFLGDLPLIGRLFQSKALESTKVNLIIFVSANIYRNDGELLNPPEVVNASDILTGHATFSQSATP